MKNNRIKVFFGLIACVSLMAVGCSGGDGEPKLTEEQKAQNAASEAEQLKGMEAAESAGQGDTSPDRR